MMPSDDYKVREPDDLVPLKAPQATRKAYDQARQSGSSVLEIRDGQLVETQPDGSMKVLRKAAPRVKVEAGIKIRLR